MKYQDYYAALGVPPDANADAIKKAYRKLARAHHPDMSTTPGSDARFKEIGEAYGVLKDPEKRAAYDELGRRPAGQAFSPPPQWNQDFGAAGPSMDDGDLAELLAALAARRHGAGGRGQGPAPRPGRDYETTVRISLEDAHRGTTLNLDVAHGDGSRTMAVTVPPGVSEGQKLRLRGKGGPGRHGAADGDIYLHISLQPHAVFRPDRHDLYFDLALAPWEAALGAELEVPTLDGPVMLTVPAGTRSGRKLRLRGRGLATGHGARGDLYAVTHVDVPATLSPRERELFTELSRESVFNPRTVVAREKAHAPDAS